MPNITEKGENLKNPHCPHYLTAYKGHFNDSKLVTLAQFRMINRQSVLISPLRDLQAWVGSLVYRHLQV